MFLTDGKEGLRWRQKRHVDIKRLKYPRTSLSIRWFIECIVLVALVHIHSKLFYLQSMLNFPTSPDLLLFFCKMLTFMFVRKGDASTCLTGESVPGSSSGEQLALLRERPSPDLSSGSRLSRKYQYK